MLLKAIFAILLMRVFFALLHRHRENYLFPRHLKIKADFETLP